MLKLYELEILAIIRSLKKFRVYLLHMEFKIYILTVRHLSKQCEKKMFV